MCRAGCLTKDHDSYAACLQAASIHVAYCDEANRKDLTRQKKWDRELQDYRDARRQGIEPAGTDRGAIERAIRVSDMTGFAFDANKPTAHLGTE